MKPIKIIIIGLFVFTGIMSYLLYIQKANRVNTQIGKKNLGWNPISIKKMIVSRYGRDTLIFSKQDGIWKSNNKFDADEVATQIINYLSTMQLTSAGNNSLGKLQDQISLQTFDKNGNPINTIAIGNETVEGKCLAHIDANSEVVLVSNKQNKMSLRSLIETNLR